MKYLLYLSFFNIIFLLIGCSNNIRKDEIVGKYIVEYPYGKEILTIKTDNKYEQRIIFNTGNSFQKNEGEWNIKDMKITFKHYKEIDNGFGKINYNVDTISWMCTLPIRSILGKVSILKNEDLGFTYEKQN